MTAPFSHWSNFRYWSFHVLLNAAPSFIIACAITTVSLDARIAGMIAGVVTFIAGYTLVTGSPWFRRKVIGSSFGTALKWATRIRSALAAVALVGSVGWFRDLRMSFLMPLSWLEMWAGLLAGQLTESAGKLPLVRNLRVTLLNEDASVRAKSWWLGDMNSAIPTYLWTLTEGLILSLFMAAIALLIWISTKIKRCPHRNSDD